MEGTGRKIRISKSCSVHSDFPDSWGCVRPSQTDRLPKGNGVGQVRQILVQALGRFIFSAGIPKPCRGGITFISDELKGELKICNCLMKGEVHLQVGSSKMPRCCILADSTMVSAPSSPGEPMISSLDRFCLEAFVEFDLLILMARRTCCCLVLCSQRSLHDSYKDRAMVWLWSIPQLPTHQKCIPRVVLIEDVRKSEW